jgi:hypothetical protein
MTISIYQYNKNDFTSFENKYASVLPGLVGVTVNELVDFAPLLDIDGNIVGRIKFNSIVNSTVTFPSISNVTENISIILDEGTTIFTLNNYNGENGSFYENGSKFILSIISCTGSNVTKKGYVVIDVFEEIRNVYVKLE